MIIICYVAPTLYIESVFECPDTDMTLTCDTLQLSPMSVLCLVSMTLVIPYNYAYDSVQHFLHS
jgi:hypothetical protein